MPSLLTILLKSGRFTRSFQHDNAEAVRWTEPREDILALLCSYLRIAHMHRQERQKLFRVGVAYQVHHRAANLLGYAGFNLYGDCIANGAIDARRLSRPIVDLKARAVLRRSASSRFPQHPLSVFIVAAHIVSPNALLMTEHPTSFHDSVGGWGEVSLVESYKHCLHSTRARFWRASSAIFCAFNRDSSLSKGMPLVFWSQIAHIEARA